MRGLASQVPATSPKLSLGSSLGRGVVGRKWAGVGSGGVLADHP